MSLTRLFLLMIGVLQSLSVPQALASVAQIREPLIANLADGKPGFALSEKASAAVFGQSENGLRLAVFSEAAKRCDLEETEILEQLSHELDDPVLWTTLAQAFDSPLEKAKKIRFTLLVTGLEENRHTFESFFLNTLPDLHQRVIDYDVSS